MVSPYSYSKYWFFLTLIGILLMLVGIGAIASPFIATFASLAVLGYLLIIGGIVQVIFAFSTWKKGDFVIHFLLGLFGVLIGGLIIARPEVVAASITLILAVMFLTLGLFRVFGSIITRYGNWGWFLFGGILDLILGILILFNWPTSALWIIGLFVGIDFLFVGWTIFITSFLIKSLKVNVIV